MSPNKIEKRLLQVACLFLLTAGLALTLAPLVRARTTTLDWHELRGSHWIPLLLWAGGFSLLHTQLKRWMSQRDPYLLPCAALLSGWGLLTIDRLNPALGVRQGCWLFLACCLVSVGTRYPDILVQLRRFKTLGVTVGLLLTGLTLFLGINPLGAGPNLWLGGSGFYIQPSEFLKLFLAIYICAYLAERFSGEKHPSRQVFSTLVPTLALIGVALALLLVQKDLGTVCIIIFLYAVILYMAIGRSRILWISASLLTGLAAAGYVLFDVIRLRVDAWLNPWADPSGRSYQIIQSMMAIANGGLLGRGLGLGHPALVPVAHSDFIFAAICEEYGLIGAFVMIAVLAIFFQRGMLIASHVQDRFLAYLCAGTTALTAGQGALIIGGNLRLFPLTGVTLPFVSYGGSSLIMSFLILFILLHASQNLERQANLIQPRIVQLSVVMVGVFAAIGLLLVWWSVFRAPEILARTDNARRSIADFYVRRGSLLDRLDIPLTASTWFMQEENSDRNNNRGYYQRVYLYPALAPVLGYTHPVYGQSGIEAGLDPVLRGFSGNSEVVIWWNHIVYGDPPPGLDVKLTIHTALQRQADESLGGARSALVLMDARRGDILAMASSPTFDANQLGDIGDEQGTAYWQKLIQDNESPLLNRSAQGRYSPGAALSPFVMAAHLDAGGILPDLPGNDSYLLADWRDRVILVSCMLPLGQRSSDIQKAWGAALGSGCPAEGALLSKSLEERNLLAPMLKNFGFLDSPYLPLPVTHTAELSAGEITTETMLGGGELPPGKLFISPLQMARAVSVLSNAGKLPAPRLASGMRSAASSAWQPLPQWNGAGESLTVIQPQTVEQITGLFAVDGLPIWQIVAGAQWEAPQNKPHLTWYLAGTIPGHEPALALSLVLEEDNPEQAVRIGQAILKAALESYR